jgi:hypothetical protein
LRALELEGGLNDKLAEMASAAIARPYPYLLQHLVQGPADALLPRTLHPTFHGCFDWHSAVHSHWALVRLLRSRLAPERREAATALLDDSFTPAKLEAEAAYLARPGCQNFERPYGLAWCLALAAELGALEHPRATGWRLAFCPLEAAALANFEPWLDSLQLPVRSGTHQQSAFALGLLLDWAEQGHRAEQRRRLRALSLRLYASDRHGPLEYEPSGEDFLSPCLMEAELMSRLLPGGDFANWLAAFLPGIPLGPDPDWLPVARVIDEADGKAVHLHGLNLSRAWNLQRIAAALPVTDLRSGALLDCGERHAAAGLAAVRTVSDFSSTHWLASFAVFLITRARYERFDLA